MGACKSFFKPKPHFVLSLPVIDELIGEMFRVGGHAGCLRYFWFSTKLRISTSGGR
jgi:hypothetical protein